MGITDVPASHLLGPGSAVGQEFSEGVAMGEEGGGGAWRHAFHIADPP